jgi:beta-galactosidase
MVPPGDYEVILLFSELNADNGPALAINLGDDPLAGETESRVFGVSINGEKVLDALNIQAEAGTFSALDKSFNVQVGAGNRLEIMFLPIQGNPVISGIVIKVLHEKVSNRKG